MPKRVVLLALTLVGCSPPPSVDTEFLAMGTVVSITVAGDLPDDARQVIAQTRARIEQLGGQWYAWNADGELPRLNAALAAGQAFTASPELAGLLQRARDYSRLSQGAFDPGVGALVKMWGMHTDKAPKTLPSAEQLEAWRSTPPSIADIDIRGSAVSSNRRDVFVDLGAIAKGFAVDGAIEQLRQHGIRHAMVNAGGNLRAVGSNNGRAWRIAIRDPRAPQPLGFIELQNDESAATSGDYERVAVVNGKRVHHLLDPRLGEPVEHTIAVTVLADNATLADAASTAIFVAGPDRWRDVARALGVDLVLRVDADGAVHVTRGLQARMQRASSEVRRTEWQVVEL